MVSYCMNACHCHPTIRGQTESTLLGDDDMAQYKAEELAPFGVAMSVHRGNAKLAEIAVIAAQDRCSPIDRMCNTVPARLRAGGRRDILNVQHTEYSAGCQVSELSECK